MAIDKEIKKKINRDWQDAFPQLSIYSQNKLYKIIGPLIIGLELIKSPFTDSYSPYFMMYSLWKSDIKTNLDYPIILKYFKNKKGFQFEIPYEQDSIYFDEVLESVHKQLPISFDEGISLDKVVSVLDEYSKTPPLSAAPNSYLQAVVYEAKLKISLYLSSDHANTILQEIEQKDWDINHFKACGVVVSNWILDLYECIANREDFLRQIEINKQDKKISKLYSSELIL
ncbi:hypothetical protein EGY07_13595 [Chryseobacterium indologenes]|uniref:Uncharacterized protein n=1 Tax=Chryseobacterium indologenes TaxID=253 RepID=A0AAD0Z061_CHRID|nr:hypothetical protein [Chryseobacterium indologenes]AYZ36525.1 hypothetical protein EGY07_13595 [Chryseobacterium indologenes]AZB20332.1 hypothetical protein EG352_22550 [Chryseobacterium indologenes]MBF6645210.1 hypothetical protein [Chryseobacterium indologenes]MBU3049028.1 hypothetical protein [Chryseobacterium indologenes]MEB4759486.1 hypothetical protein [Chryseobacterium indologenes]